MCGLPGAGKTTLAGRLAAEVPAVRLCPDEWMARLGIDLYDEDTRERLERTFWSLTQDLLRLGQSVVLEWGFWVRMERDEKRLGARALGAAVELHYLDVPVDELCRRLEIRNRVGMYGTVVITPEMVEQYLKVFEPPSQDELALFDEPPAGHRHWM